MVIESKPAVVRFGCSFRSGDKVMQTINDYGKDIFNGDLGFVHAVDPEAQELVIDFDGRLVSYDFGELDEIVPAYAISDSQVAGLGISGGRDSAFDPALPDAAAQFGLYGDYAGQAAGRAGGAAQGLGNRGQGFAGRAQVVKTASMAAWRSRARCVNDASCYLASSQH